MPSHQSFAASGRALIQASVTPSLYPKGNISPQETASHQDTYQPLNDFKGRFQFWDLVQEHGGHRLQGFCRPLVKPVNGAAVDKGGELP